MRVNAAAILLLVLPTGLAGCVQEPAHSSWSSIGWDGYHTHCSGCTAVANGRYASASVANWGDLTTVTSSAGDSDASVATDGTSSAVVASAGGAHAAVGTSGGYVSISTGATSASASLGADGGVSHGTTSAGGAEISW